MCYWDRGKLEVTERGLATDERGEHFHGGAAKGTHGQGSAMLYHVTYHDEYAWRSFLTSESVNVPHVSVRG